MSNGKSHKKRLALHWRILISIALGIAAGIFLCKLTPYDNWSPYVKWAGDIFLRGLRMIVIPLVFTSIALGVAGMGNSATLGRIAGKTIAYYLATTAIAAVIGLILVNLINPNQMADDMKKNGGFIPGVKPGKKTAEYLENILSKITLPGSIFLAIVAILPAIIRLFGVNTQFAQFYGGTSLLILVGVILDTLQQIESHLLMRHYDGLTKTGRIKGRTSMSI